MHEYLAARQKEQAMSVHRGILPATDPDGRAAGWR
jgi:hypothetical protein